MTGVEEHVDGEARERLQHVSERVAAANASLNEFRFTEATDD